MKRQPPRNKSMDIGGKSYIFACFSSELYEGIGRRIILDEFTELAAFRFKGALYCLSNICPHNHLPSIYKGFIEGSILTCPEHGWSFDIETGKNLNSLKNLDKYGIFEKDGCIWVEDTRSTKPKWMT